jgi:hypothetical protein
LVPVNPRMRLASVHPLSVQDPESDVALFLKGGALFQLGQSNEALAALDAVPETSSVFRLAVSFETKEERIAYAR